MLVVHARKVQKMKRERIQFNSLENYKEFHPMLERSKVTLTALVENIKELGELGYLSFSTPESPIS